MNMVKKAILSAGAPQPVGSYSQAVAVGPWLFLSGQIPLVPETGKIISRDITAQTERVMDNIQAILKTHQMNFNNVVKTGIFLKNMEHFSAVDKVYRRYFEELSPSSKDTPSPVFPSRSCVAVQELPKGVDIEIEILAVFSH